MTNDRLRAPAAGATPPRNAERPRVRGSHPESARHSRSLFETRAAFRCLSEKPSATRNRLIGNTHIRFGKRCFDGTHVPVRTFTAGRTIQFANTNAAA